MYVDWFAPLPRKHCRRAPPGSPWLFRWAAPHYSWLMPPARFAHAAVQKCIAEGVTGTFLAAKPAAAAEWFDTLRSRASIVFKIKHQPNTFTLPDGSPAHHASSWFAFVIDDFSSTARDQEEFSIAIHQDWDTLYRSAPSPLNLAAFRKFLSFHPDDAFVTRTLRGLTYGRSYGYTGTRTIHRACTNPPDWARYERQLLEIRDKEASAGWRAGPFPTSGGPPLFNLLCSPCKGTTKTFSDKIRHVNNMSYPHDASSVNHNIPDGNTKTATFNHAARLLAYLGKGTLMFKFDVKSAYKLVRLAPQDYHLNGELTPQGFSFSTRPNFGAKSAGDIWDDYGGATEFIIRWHSLLRWVCRYTDDFLGFVPQRPGESPSAYLARATAIFSDVKRICDILGVPIGKFEGPSTRLVWLGLILDSSKMAAEVTLQRKVFLTGQLRRWVNRRSARRRKLESIIGHLQFITRVVTVGKAFLGRLFAIAKTKLHPDAWVKIDLAARKDFQWWADFLPNWSGVSLLRDLAWVTGSHLELETDACRTGGGCFFAGHWFVRIWPLCVLQQAMRATPSGITVSMPFLELLAIALACSTFGHHWARRRILLRTDCEPAELALNRLHSRNPEMQSLIRSIMMLSITHNFDLRLEHIPGAENTRADLLSRSRVREFLQVTPSADPSPTTVLPLPCHPYS